MHLYGLNLDELIRSRPNWSLFSRLRFFEGTQLSPTSRGELNWLKMHVSGWALASIEKDFLMANNLLKQFPVFDG